MATNGYRSGVTVRASSGAVGRLARDGWGVADQALISASNFVTMVLVARGLAEPAEFGKFTLVYSALLFSNMLQAALITQPHNVLGSARRGRPYAAYTTSTAMAQLLLIALEGLLALTAAAVAWKLSLSIVPLLLALVPSIAAWQLQEFVRRVLYTEGRHRDAFVNDLLSYAGQAVALAALWKTHRLTGASALYALAATSALAAAVGAWQIRHSLMRPARVGAFRENWHFGKWLLGAEVLTWCSSIHMYLYVAAAVLGPAATAALKVAQTLFGPTRVLAYYLDTVLPIRFARLLNERGEESLRGSLASVLARVAPGMAAFCAAVALSSRPLLRLTFGAQYAGAATVLVLYSAYALLTYVQMVVAAALKGRRMTHIIFAGSACGLAVSLAAVLLLVRTFGTAGVLGGMICGAVVILAQYLRAVQRVTRPAAPATVAPRLAGAAREEEPCPS